LVGLLLASACQVRLNILYVAGTKNGNCGLSNKIDTRQTFLSLLLSTANQTFVIDGVARHQSDLS
jgi:hypothetical protein